MCISDKFVCLLMKFATYFRHVQVVALIIYWNQRRRDGAARWGQPCEQGFFMIDLVVNFAPRSFGVTPRFCSAAATAVLSYTTIRVGRGRCSVELHQGRAELHQGLNLKKNPACDIQIWKSEFVYPNFLIMIIYLISSLYCLKHLHYPPNAHGVQGINGKIPFSLLVSI